MYGATGDALLQKTLLIKLPGKKRSKHKVRSKPIPLRTTSNRSKYDSRGETRIGEERRTSYKKKAENQPHRRWIKLVTRTRNKSIELREGPIGKMIEYL